MAVRTCSHCHKSHRITSADAPVCPSCATPYQALRPASAKQPPSARLILAILAAGFILFVIAGVTFSNHIGANYPPPRSIEQIQHDQLREKVRKDLEREQADNQRAARETLERIRQKQSR